VLKVELHAHTSLDPADLIPHSTRDLIDCAAAQGYGAIAVTLHDRYYDPSDDLAYARDRRIVLIPGIERTVDGSHVLLLNFPAACAAVTTFEDIRALKARHPDGLVIAPHLFFPIRSALRSDAARHEDLIDAVEVSSMFTAWVNFNRAAVAWARARRKPLVGTSDLHLLAQLGTTYTLVDATPDADAICAAIRSGRVEVRSTPLPWTRAAALFAASVVLGLAGRARWLWQPIIGAAKEKGMNKIAKTTWIAVGILLAIILIAMMATR